VDLLFFNRVIKSLVAIDLKIGEFEPEYIGKMNFYLGLLDDKIKMKDENPSIGLKTNPSELPNTNFICQQNK
jgi:hypothetical protein